MIARLLGVVAWLLAGHALLGGLYWTLLNVPESNSLALAASALLALSLLIVFGIVDTTALIALNRTWTWRAALARAVRLLPVFLVALLVWLGVSWIAGWLESAHATHGTEIDAWLIARFNWTKTEWLHRAIGYALLALRYVIGLSLAVSIVAVAAFGSIADAIRLRWIPRGLAPRQLVPIALAIIGFIWLPWRAVYWRPRALPYTSIELAFVAIKLLAIAVLIHIGWTLILWAAHRRTPPPAAGEPVLVPVPAPAPTLSASREEPLS